MTATEDIQGATATEVEEGKVKSRRVARSAGFPGVTLADAVELTKRVANYGTKHTAESVAGHLGHSTTNSGPFRSKVAALKDYGLLSGRGDEIIVTVLGKELAHPGVTTDSQALLRAAFGSCELFATLIDALPVGVRLKPESIGNTAVTNYNVSPASKVTFTHSFVDSAEAAGFLEKLSDGDVQKIETEGSGAPFTREELEEAAEERDSGGASLARKRTPLVGSGVIPVVHHVWPLPGGAMTYVLEFDAPLPAQAYGMIKSLIEAGDALRNFLTESERIDASATD